MSVQHPPYPPLGRLRLATIDDIPRIAEVALAGFAETALFGWVKPYHHQYPKDSLKAYQYAFSLSLYDPGCVVIVAEDALKPSENDHVTATIDPDQEIPKPSSGQPIVVGVMSIKLTGNARWHQFNHKGENNFRSGRNRDADTARSNIYHARHREAVEEWDFVDYSTGRLVIDMICRYFKY